MGAKVLGVEVQVGEAAVAGPMQVFPLFGSGGTASSYVTGARALASGAVAVRED